MQNIINPFQTIGIIGLAKNTGKTTTLNKMIDMYKAKKIGLTSIGLDGEELDQVNFLPKPRINVFKGMVIATTQVCLNQSSITYEVLKKVDIFTALGPIILVEVLTNGQVIIAGPTTNKDLKKVIEIMKPYTDKVFIDGAFNRMTFANLNQIDGIILATGASVHPVMQKTIERTQAIVEAFQLESSHLYDSIPSSKMVIYESEKIHEFHHKNYDNLSQLFEKYHQTIKKIYIQGAITPKIIELFVDRNAGSFELIVDDPTKFLISDQYFNYFKKLNIKLSVIHPNRLLCVTINPFRPTGESYDSDQFLSNMKKAVSIPVFNVLNMEVQHGKT